MAIGRRSPLRSRAYADLPNASWAGKSLHTMSSEQDKLIVKVEDLRKMLRRARESPFLLGDHFDTDNIVEIAKSQFPRLEARVAMHYEMEQTKRLLIIVAGVCLVAGAALVVFAPQGKEGVSYVVAVALVVLSLGAVGIQEFRLRAFSVRLDAGADAVARHDTKTDK